MDIHQISVVYDRNEDRLLMRIRSRQNQLYPVWITRRLAIRLWPAFNDSLAKISSAALASQATLHPEAREMLVESARAENLKKSDFKTPFDESNLEQPLGPLPLLAHEVQMQMQPGQLGFSVLDAQGRKLGLQLAQSMVTAVRELMLKALRESEWGIEDPPAAATQAAPAVPAPSRLLN
ncbi:hypothetical protein [Inhella gelatinilytica]|uniref:Uncharacterized protein n=1 Tax=Inhella gelatinilytica TaxID=2795030 RepID=A0A931NEL8_9BURK|nr:hypothetical protein [Inhella gelatinilytica]MBH9552651.1 hypothetical protein [Inhella gelatinilytica]